MSSVETSGSEESVKNPKEEIEKAAWEVILFWDSCPYYGQHLSSMSERVEALRQALSDGDTFGLTDPQSPYYRPIESSNG